MKRYIFFIILSSGLVFCGLAQTKDKKTKAPKEDIKVNREYDEQGNLIRFDSTYTYNWSGDTTILNGQFPDKFDHFFDNHSKFFNDSSFMADPFFGDFDQLFASPFSNKRDSLLMKKFGKDHFNFFNFEGDSIMGSFKGFDEFIGQINPDKKDSISSGKQKNPWTTSPHSMQEMMKIMQHRMQEMQEYHRQLFDKQSRWKEF